MRKVLTLCELVDCVDIIKVNAPNFLSMGKSDKKEIWKEYIDRNFPDLKECPFCNEHDRIEYSPSVTMSSWHIPGSVAKITCTRCDLQFTGNYYCGTVIEQWNSR